MFFGPRPSEAECKVCGKRSEEVSATLGVCARCIKERFAEAESYLCDAHSQVRRRYGLSVEPPRAEDGMQCVGCGNRCMIPLGGKGFCGVVENVDGKLVRRFGSPDCGLLQFYYDSLPTNCVPADFCAGSSGAGYPKWCRTPKGDLGLDNLAVFIGSCTYSCLFCQNYSFRELTKAGRPMMSAAELAARAGKNIGCVCYFGGDPASQMPFVISSAELIHKRAEREKRILRVCLETNLSMNRRSLERFVEISLESGGGVKADLKCWSSEILYALCGVRHRQAFENFTILGRRHGKRPEVPLARASTLLVPSYVDEEEIRSIASFIADLNPTIPYSLLAFHPLHFMEDMPPTKRRDAEKFLKICKEEGLEKVRIGNPWLLV